MSMFVGVLVWTQEANEPHQHGRLSSSTLAGALTETSWTASAVAIPC